MRVCVREDEVFYGYVTVRMQRKLMTAKRKIENISAGEVSCNEDSASTAGNRSAVCTTSSA